jgi:hypothetical protein
MVECEVGGMVPSRRQGYPRPDRPWRGLRTPDVPWEARRVLPLAAIVSVDPFPETATSGRGTAFLVLAAFLGTFLFIRTSARLIRNPKVTWWPGNVEAGGLHIHHLVWGICLVLIAGFLGFAADLENPWWHVSAIAFGIGAGLTIDEFALWLYLRDVYWSQQGRLSVDAAVIATAFALLVVLGTRPFGLDEPESVLGTAVLVAQAVALSAIAFLKGRFVIGVVTLFLPFWGLIGAVRLAKPDSPWARWRYGGPRAGRLDRARRRFREDRPAAALGERVVALSTGLSAQEDGTEGPTAERR